jgi:hypothetical protein
MQGGEKSLGGLLIAHIGSRRLWGVSKRIEQNASARRRKWSLKASYGAVQLTHDLRAKGAEAGRDCLPQDQTEGWLELLA